MRAAARALNVPLETMLNRAGYKTSPRRNDVEGRLAGLGQLLFVGKLDLAILGLLRLNDRIAVKRSCADPKGGGVAATDFARAFELLDRLPNLHLALILKTMQKRINDKTRV